MTHRMILAVFAALVASASPVLGQAYPSHSIRMVVPWPPGGANDAVGRWLAAPLAVALGQPVIVDNRGGQSGVVGAANVASFPADGYTLMANTVTGHVINPAVYGKLPYDTIRDFAGITLAGSVAHVIVVNPSFAPQTLGDLINLAKQKPGEINYASFGIGSTSHLSGELLQTMTGIKLMHIPYRGGGPALVDTLSGQVPLYFCSVSTCIEMIKAGKLRALAVTSARRLKLLPDIPTVDEAAGVTGYVTETMIGVTMPAGAPTEVVTRLNSELVKILATPEIKERFFSIGIDDPAPTTPQQTNDYMKSELTRWAGIVAASGTKLAD